jgi:hypothetical protein
MSTKADGEGIVCGVDWILAWNLSLAGSRAKISKLQDLTSPPPPSPPKPNSRIPMVFLFSSSARVSGLFLQFPCYTVWYILVNIATMYPMKKLNQRTENRRMSISFRSFFKTESLIKQKVAILHHCCRKKEKKQYSAIINKDCSREKTICLRIRIFWF